MNARIFGALVMLTVSGAAPELSDQTYTQWRDYIRPKADELAWETIPWRATFWNAVVEAQQAEKPILLWAMNGHPLACT